jgi:hypothetical protein
MTIEQEGINKKSYRFIRDDIRLTAYIDSIHSKQKLIMEKIDPNTNRVEMSDSIDCIHTAIYDIPVLEFQSEMSADDTTEKLKEITETALKIRSTERLKEITLSPEEKFAAFNSWVAGIAEAGVEAFKIESEIEEMSNLATPIVNRLIRFVSLVDPPTMLDYISKIERECMFEGSRHESSLIANLDPILKSVNLESSELTPQEYIILKAIVAVNPPIWLFTIDEHNMLALKYSLVAMLQGFEILFNSEISLVKQNLASNFGAAECEHYRKYLSYKTEPDYQVRLRAAANPMATQFTEYLNFFTERTEPNNQVRMRAAINESAVQLDGYTNFLNPEIEKNEEVRAFAAINRSASKLPQFRNLFFESKEPSIYVRSLVASNPLNVEFDEYENFLSHLMESNIEVRKDAAMNKNATKFPRFENLLDPLTEPSEQVRIHAVANPGAIKFKNFKKIIEGKIETNKTVIETAKTNSAYLNNSNNKMNKKNKRKLEI